MLTQRALTILSCACFSLLTACVPPPKRVSFTGKKPDIQDSLDSGQGAVRDEAKPAVEQPTGHPTPPMGNEPEAPKPENSESPTGSPPEAPREQPKDPVQEQREIAARFAPIIRMHNQEPYLPMDFDDFFYKPEKERTEEFFRSSRQALASGRQARTVVNVSEDRRLIQYWIFHAKNGCQGARLKFRLTGPLKLGKIGEKTRVLEICNLAIHEGDWEDITVQLNGERTRVERAYLSAHGKGNWLPASALEFRGERPYVYASLNSHALHARGVDFAADATIDHSALDASLGIQWFQIGDSVTHGSALKQDSSNGAPAIDFDTQKAFVVWPELKDTNVGRYNGPWGKAVDGKTVVTPPDISVGPIELILRAAVSVAFQVVSELKNASSGNAPGSPWGRGDWNDYDRANQKLLGLSRDPSAGGEGGDAFDDYEKLKPKAKLRVLEIWASGGPRLNRVCLKLEDGGDLCHGGGGGTEQRLVMEAGEYVTRQDVAFGQVDDSKRAFAIKFTTSKGRTLQVGTWTGDFVNQIAPAGMQISGWYGFANTEIDRIGPVYSTLPD